MANLFTKYLSYLFIIKHHWKVTVFRKYRPFYFLIFLILFSRPMANLGHSHRDSLTNPMLITAF